MKQLAALFCIIAGLALAAYGVALIVGLDTLTFFSKYSAAGRDTNSATLILLIGITLALFGWFGSGGKGGNTSGQ